MSPDQFDKLEIRLAARHDAELTTGSDSNKGSIKGHGALANFEYRPQAQQLDIVLLWHPWYATEAATEAAIEENIRKMIQ